MKSFRICMQNIRKWGSNSRIKMCLIMSFLFVYSYISGMWKIIPLVGEKMNPWIFPFLLCWRFMKIVFMAPIVFIFCDDRYYTYMQALLYTHLCCFFLR